MRPDRRAMDTRPLREDDHAFIEAIAHKVAETVAADLATKWGIDKDNPLEMQEDMSFLRKWRKTMEKVSLRVVMVLVSIITGGVILAAWEALKKGAP